MVVGGGSGLCYTLPHLFWKDGINVERDGVEGVRFPVCNVRRLQEILALHKRL